MEMDKTLTTGAATFLHRIVENRRQLLDRDMRTVPLSELIGRADEFGPPRGFRSAVTPDPDKVAVIAELKKASPSRGVIRQDFAAVELARCLAHNGAAALSVLTEPDFFLGDPASLGLVRREVGLPLLRKDFIVNPYQVHESRALGADALLLIVKIVDPGLLVDLMGTAREVGLDALVEVNTECELDTALSAGADLIGINNRNLETFDVDRDTAARLCPLIPDGITTVALSGIRSRDDIDDGVRAGIRSFLIGETLMRIPDIGDMGRQLRALTQSNDDSTP
jgi:indole-3-glycerol phosphate synthase